MTLILVVGGTIAVEDATGRQQHGSFVTGLGFGWSRKRLWSRFHSQIGLPHKRAATTARPRTG